MARKLVNESVIDKFIDKIFDAIKKRKTAQITKKMKDPELDRRVDDWRKSHDELETYLNKKYGETK